MERMKAAVFHGSKPLAIEEIEIPEVNSNEVLVKVKACSICGTDLHIYGKGVWVKPPVVLGHELAGEVVKIGGGVTSIKVGDRVTVDSVISCHICNWCREGYYNLCSQQKSLGVTYNGGFAEYAKLPAFGIHLLPQELSYEEAAMVEPSAVAFHTVERAGVKKGESVTVIGAGTIGLLTLQLAKLSGANPLIVTEPMEKRRRLAQGLGADLVIDPTKENAIGIVKKATNGGPAIVFECVGKSATTLDALRMANRRSRVVIVGVFEEQSQVEWNYVVMKELNVLGSYAHISAYPQVIKLISEGKLKAKPLISHTLPLGEINRAFELGLSREEAIKIQILP